MRRLVAVPFAIACFSASLAPAVAQDGYFRTLGKAVEDVSPGIKTRPISLMPGVVFKFGETKYAVTGTEPCPAPPLPAFDPPESGCISASPGMVEAVYLRKIGTKNAIRSGIRITGTTDVPVISLTSMASEDGTLQTFSPPLSGQLVPDEGPSEKWRYSN